MSIKAKEFLSLKNLAVLMCMIIILTAYQCHYDGIILLFIAIAAIFCGYKIKQDTIKYSLFAWGVPFTLVALLFSIFDLRFNIPLWAFGIVIFLILAYGIYKSVNILDKVNLCIEIALCLILISPYLGLFSIYDSPIIGITLSSIPFILFFLLFIGFMYLSYKETSNDSTKKACLVSIIGSIINLALFCLYIAFAIALPEHSFSLYDYTSIPRGEYPFYDWCQSMDGKVIIFVIAGLAMAAYYINLGIRSQWKLSNICVSGIVAMFGIGVITAFVAGNMNEYVYGLNVQGMVPIIYYLTASLIVYSNYKLIKKM